MNRREYVKAAIRHEVTDRVPYCIRLTGEAISLYGERLLKDFPNAEVEEDYREKRIGLTTAVELSIGNYMVETPFPWWDWDYERLPAVYKDPLGEPDRMPPLYSRFSEESTANMHRVSKLLSEKYGVYVPALVWASHWEKAYFARGIENFLADLAAIPDFAEGFLRFIVDKNMEILPTVAACPHIDGILLGSDWGSQKDLIMSPATWRELIKPGEMRQYEVIREGGKDVMIHSCGNIVRILDDLVEMGVKILNPIQPECMDIALLKEKYGSALTFWGGISTQRTLPYGTPAEVRTETERVIRLMSEGGGYISSSAQEIQTDVPYENLKALIETVKSFAE